ncbi:MAG TPA: hypothetical protein VMU18_12835 [Rhodoblastus sp.]|nr:hypothetical protein [Rhodoblastus sp.]
MGRFHLQFEDQNVLPRRGEGLRVSILFVVRMTFLILALGSAIAVLVRYVTGDDMAVERLLEII